MPIVGIDAGRKTKALNLKMTQRYVPHRHGRVDGHPREPEQAEWQIIPPEERRELDDPALLRRAAQALRRKEAKYQ